MVTEGNAVAANMQLARHADRHLLVRSIQHVYYRVTDWSTDWYRGLFVAQLRNRIATRKGGALRRSDSH